MVNFLRFGLDTSDLDDKEASEWEEAIEYLISVKELSYLTQIVIKIYQISGGKTSDCFECDIEFSPGLNCETSETGETVAKLKDLKPLKLKG